MIRELINGEPLPEKEIAEYIDNLIYKNDEYLKENIEKTFKKLVKTRKYLEGNKLIHAIEYYAALYAKLTVLKGIEIYYKYYSYETWYEPTREIKEKEGEIKP